MLKKDSRIYVAGHRGLVGSALVRRLKADEYKNILTRTRNELDLTDSKAVSIFFKEEKPEYVFQAAAKVGGILANSTFPAEFIYENLAIQTNLIHQCYVHEVKKLLFLGSSCIYPKDSKQPIKEEYLLTGILEPTNEPYAVAKIAGIKMCQAYNKQYGTNYISVMPTNLYGPGDNYDLENSHVLAALIRKTHEAKVNSLPSIVIWGTGNPRREFLYVDDLADACLFLMNKYDSNEIINVGSGYDLTIMEIAALAKEVIGYKGEIVLDKSKPDGVKQKLLNLERINSLGWHPRYKLIEGLQLTYLDFIERVQSII